jgi:hypothetical protein
MPTGILEKGDTFADGQVVNAARLNNLVDLGDVLAGLISSQSLLAPPDPISGDFLLYVTGTPPTLYKCDLSQLPQRVSSVGLDMPSGEFVVANSPITTFGTFVVGWQPNNLNKFLACPSDGSNGLPHFRRIQMQDMVLAPVAIPADIVYWNLGTTFTKVLSGNTTFTFQNLPDPGLVQDIVMRVSQPSSPNNYTVGWPSDIYWQFTTQYGNNPPIQSTGAGAADLYFFKSINGIVHGWFRQAFAP